MQTQDHLNHQRQKPVPIPALALMFNENKQLGSALLKTCSALSMATSSHGRFEEVDP